MSSKGTKTAKAPPLARPSVNKTNTKLQGNCHREVDRDLGDVVQVRKEQDIIGSPLSYFSTSIQPL